MLRKSLFGILVLALLTPMATIAAAQTADELVAKNIAAKGGMDKLKSVKSMRASGKMVGMQGMEFPFVMTNKRPKSTKIEFTFQGMTGMQVYDGKTAWMSMPFAGKKEPEVMPAEQAKDMEEQADFDGPLVDYKTKGNTVELVGKEQVEGADAYNLKVTLKNGDVRNIYLDAETYLEIKVASKRMVRGTEVEGESYLSDYKEVEGLMMPHVMENAQKGSAMRQKLVIEKVEINPVIDDSIFSMASVAGADSTAAKDATKAASDVKDVTKSTGKAAKADATKATKKP
jgi:outer membrane lipoprotein-sorting protein